MANIDDILKSVEDQSAALAQKLIAQYTQQAIADTKDFLQNARADLERWTNELEDEDIEKDDFEGYIRGQKDLAEMRALKQAGLAQVSIDTFTNGVLDIVINAAFAALKI
jgi:predicted  nucleic acid-binding Zn-ribbon protein